MTEIWASAELAKVGIKPRRTGILYGPPGCGKTTLAHHFSARLGVPLVNVKMDALVSSHVGATGNNIASLFEQLTGQESACVLFLDELEKKGVGVLPCSGLIRVERKNSKVKTQISKPQLKTKNF